jgi:hypothetical protein
MPRHLAVAVALALIAVCGVVHGLSAGRWHTSQALQDAVARVELVPMEIGEWKAEPVESDPRAFEQAGALGYWTRQYTSGTKRQTVLAILMCGRAGRMAVHTPEVCYGGAGYDLDGAPSASPMRTEAGQELGTFFSARFTKSGGLGADLRLYWAWNAGDGWQAPRSPRWELRGRPYVYKLYVSHDLAPGSDRDPAADFLRQLLPELRKTLLPGEP